MSRRGVWALAVAVAATACGGGSGGGAQTGAAPARGGANVIIESEITSALGVNNALEVIQRLRPAMLRTRAATGVDGTSGNGLLVVYVDGIKTGDLDTLTAIAAINIKEIRFISASDATTRFGTGHPSGAIMVATKR